MKDKWLDDLRQGMSDYEMDVPEGLWEELEREASLSDEEIRGSITKPAWGRFKIVCVASLLLLFAGVGLVYLMKSTENVSLQIKEADVRVARMGDEVFYDSVRKIEEKEKDSAGKRVKVLKSIAQIVRDSNEDSSEEKNGAAIEEMSVGITANTVDSVVAQESESRPVCPSGYEGLEPHRNLSFTKEKSENGKISVSVSASGGAGSSLMGKNMLADPYWNLDFIGSKSPIDGSDDMPPYFEETTSTSYRLPIRAAVNVQYRINPRLGVETGLAYTSLSSETKISSKYYLAINEQTLQYIGIPLKIIYTPLLRRWGSVYLSSGVEIDKCVHNSVKKSVHVIKSEESEEYKETGNIRPFQCSVKLSAGFQFNITDNIGVYAEPGIGYYFNDGTRLNTIYKDRPLNFDLNFGLRFTFRGR